MTQVPGFEIRTTISPTPNFFRRIHYMAASMRRLGPKMVDHEIVVSVGGGVGRDNLHRSQPWSNLYPIVWRWVDPEAYARRGYEATNRDRYLHMGRASLVMLADADVIFIDDFGDLLAELEHGPAICGVMAHISPFMKVRQRSPRTWWRLLAQAFDMPELPFDCTHSGWQSMFKDEDYRHSPIYLNGGMIVGPVELMERMFALMPAAAEAVERVIRSTFRPQLARTLAMYKAGLPGRVLPLRYNYPNDERLEDTHVGELADLRILHYLRKRVIHRDRDFMSTDSVARLVARTDLSGANERLRCLLAELHDVVAAEAGECGTRGDE